MPERTNPVHPPANDSPPTGPRSNGYVFGPSYHAMPVTGVNSENVNGIFSLEDNPGYYFINNAHGPNDQLVNGMQHSEDDADDEDDNDEDFEDHNDIRHEDMLSENIEEELHFTVLIDLRRFETPNDNIWSLVNQSRAEVLFRLQTGDFYQTIEDEDFTERVLRFDGHLLPSALALVDEANEFELVHRSLEQWLMTMLDMVSLGTRVTLPWHAGAWRMARLDN